MARELVLPAYDFILKCSHTFNLLDARGVISVTERTRYIRQVRSLARRVAQLYFEQREKLGFPLLNDDNSQHSQDIAHKEIPMPA